MQTQQLVKLLINFQVLLKIPKTKLKLFFLCIKQFVVASIYYTKAIKFIQGVISFSLGTSTKLIFGY